MDSSGPVLCSLQQWFYSLNLVPGRRTHFTDSIPVTSLARQQQSLSDLPLERRQISPRNHVREASSQDTVLYLGYGSNLSAETFRGKRNIKPLSQVNVVVPTLSLTFDLPGIPYSEPCFGNVRYRNAAATENGSGNLGTEDYHKDRWPKGLVGVVYEVTREDYIHIIATEGGGSGYQDVLVDCFALSGDATEDVPWKPSGQPFKAHTLLAPTNVSRPDHSYAQPSPRYLKLITDGAAEHALPLEYQAFLHQIRSYHFTTTKQRLGSFIFLAIWSPFLLFIFGGAGMFLRPDGTYPKWLATFLRAMFTACWASYDDFFKKTFGDGERTVGDSKENESDCIITEKEPLIEQVHHKYGAVNVVERIV
ncbi:uncharacterized protein Z518_10514 [Rhinocladiella mackenziei CBS 650.93]|uniref:gamma-glutamylcyclotransferase n=1 Tax=Rhinocladiella mackenziei CBS 650.93 TaxID=1442369 RepID=A0A0D2IUH7_9EURO|nr:uncharacterized protein Z518_10514 [Rhinocladiella mackenziei CBS 650.93]KIX00375.1 hypothetical protein Z518_10514 [Rhinocladiella mackenziei CBS 650.93]